MPKARNKFSCPVTAKNPTTMLISGASKSANGTMAQYL